MRGGFPAHAGMDPSGSADRPACPRLPRTRGDGPYAELGCLCMARASPHTRGWTPHASCVAVRAGGFPAHAGMDPAATPRPSAGRRLPRTRGDGPVRNIDRSRLSGASPHTRGWTSGEREQHVRDGGFPAHAGMDPCGRRTNRHYGRLPRTRGDGPAVLLLALDAGEASPHTRGWTRLHPLPINGAPGFPAHAGMDPTRTRHARPATWLPRTRGDGPRF